MLADEVFFCDALGWDTLQIGLAYGTSLLIGAFLGETAGGWVVDSMMVCNCSVVDTWLNLDV